MTNGYKIVAIAEYYVLADSADEAEEMLKHIPADNTIIIKSEEVHD